MHFVREYFKIRNIFFNKTYIPAISCKYRPILTEDPGKGSDTDSDKLIFMTSHSNKIKLSDP